MLDDKPAHRWPDAFVPNDRGVRATEPRQFDFSPLDNCHRHTGHLANDWPCRVDVRCQALSNQFTLSEILEIVRRHTHEQSMRQCIQTWCRRPAQELLSVTDAPPIIFEQVPIYLPHPGVGAVRVNVSGMMTVSRRWQHTLLLHSVPHPVGRCRNSTSQTSNFIDEIVDRIHMNAMGVSLASRYTRVREKGDKKQETKPAAMPATAKPAATKRATKRAAAKRAAAKPPAKPVAKPVAKPALRITLLEKSPSESLIQIPSVCTGAANGLRLV